jgi:hypothetical protein
LGAFHGKNCIIDEGNESTSEKIPRAKFEYGQETDNKNVDNLDKQML